MIHKDRVMKVGLTEQIKREISIMRLVKHPNVLQLFEVMASKSKIYFVLEYAKGGELFNKIAKGGKLSEDSARRYFHQLISAVDYCHSRGVYHRDLKPENLLLDDNENLKVSDFGLSALAESKRQDGLLHTTCGTPAYVAPEVLSRKGYDGAKADVWSCGVILFVLVAGYLPFHDTNLIEMYRKISRAEFRCPRSFSTELKDLLYKILDPDPSTRISISRIKRSAWYRKPIETHAKKSEAEATEKTLTAEVKKKENGTLKLAAPKEGKKGVLELDADIFEVAPSLFLVELKKTNGDTLEYQKLVKEEIRPALKDIVWVWQGDQQQQSQPTMQGQQPQSAFSPQQPQDQQQPSLPQQEQQGLVEAPLPSQKLQLLDQLQLPIVPGQPEWPSEQEPLECLQLPIVSEQPKN
ncbi:hypothetical protein PR202_ga09206 [Eleusine coracana subsp. coracana]|uniref:non-specific serine/threonine protein kinase n=1 Tax=Eleusine coracana subsp. coracana TaxID=191504 RepID=A0AAV5C272_ELECO|nr:hypothetical protein PR202_ga09206 [Eleusine coracana subsp. coracana]